MLCFKFCKLSNVSKIIFFLYTRTYTINILVSINCMVVLSLISKLEYAINRNRSRLLSDLISSMNLYIHVS